MYSNKHLNEFVNDVFDYLRWHGIELHPDIDTQIPSPRYPSLSELRRERVEAPPSVTQALRSFGPWSVGYKVPDQTWKVLSDILYTLPRHFWVYRLPLFYSDTAPGSLYYEDREVLDALFGCGESIIEEEDVPTKRNPLESGREIFEQRATDYLVSLLSQIATAYETTLLKAEEKESGSDD